MGQLCNQYFIYLFIFILIKIINDLDFEHLPDLSYEPQHGTYVGLL